MLVTFLGVAAARILPTISLILGNMSAARRSIHSLSKLRDKRAAATDAQFLLFRLVGVSVVGLLTLATPTPDTLAKNLHPPEGLERFGQALVAAVSILVVTQSTQMSGILHRSLVIRHEIEVDEARRKTLANAPTLTTMREALPAHPEFKDPVPLPDPQKRG